jgi:hypothetical protein
MLFWDTGNDIALDRDSQADGEELVGLSSGLLVRL